MTVKPDRWIRKMALEHRMIEPFEDRQVRDGVISYGVSSYGYDIRVADEFRVFTNVNSTTVDPKQFDERSFARRFSRSGVHYSAQLIRAGPLGGIFPHPAQRVNDLRREVDLRALRNHCQRHSIRARVGRLRDA